MEIFSALQALCAGNSPVSGEFPTQRPVTQSFDFFFDLRLNKRLSKQSWGWWYETPPCSLWRHCNEHISCWNHYIVRWIGNAIVAYCWYPGSACVTRASATIVFNVSFLCQYIDGLMQDCSNSIANAMELLQSCTKPLKYSWFLK